VLAYLANISDQPVQTGFSYDTLVNATYDLRTSTTSLLQANEDIPKQNNTFYVGTFPSNQASLAVNSTSNAARALWHFSQTFFQEFPEYKPSNNKISIWTESYGGRYGPATAAFFQQQNEKIRKGQMKDTATQQLLNLDTLGIINGCVDVISMQQAYPHMAYNNTYGLQAINKTLYQEAASRWEGPDGCLNLTLQCRSLAAQLDPSNQGGDPSVNAACIEAGQACQYVMPTLKLLLTFQGNGSSIHSVQWEKLL
jgi:carboxypeptidase C (cathepsin A)